MSEGKGVTWASSLPGPNRFLASAWHEVGWGGGTCLDWRVLLGVSWPLPASYLLYDLGQIPSPVGFWAFVLPSLSQDCQENQPHNGAKAARVP